MSRGRRNPPGGPNIYTDWESLFVDNEYDKLRRYYRGLTARQIREIEPVTDDLVKLALKNEKYKRRGDIVKYRNGKHVFQDHLYIFLDIIEGMRYQRIR